MLYYARTIVVVVLVLTVSGCSSIRNENSSTFAGSSLQPGRYAAQWSGYVGAFEGEAIYPQFLFFDFYLDRRQHPQPQFNEVQLVTDQGLIPVTVEHMGPGPDNPQYQLLIVRTKIASLPAGTYEFHKVQYIDGTQQTRMVSVGNWKVQILQGSRPKEIEEVSGSFAASKFVMMQPTVRNTSTTDITIEGLDFALPNMQVHTTMSISTGPLPMNQNMTKQGAPPSPFSSRAVDKVVLKPNQTTDIFFGFEPVKSEQSTDFVALRPFLKYRVGTDSTIHLFPLSQQMAAPPIDTSYVRTYLEQLPSDAYHPFSASQ